eukprot:CAMPEP_0117674372 /NCGR_PEP_ID=MMETSP0804-20121206/14999_1 /TAXON_ID=1074897 /ORGANISM="Tetraselmis astigmatica, Strain CCMP880" /LENGTH=1150 /DNA_ID=CAMNT_0005483229 /DNA_START=231 /DNA_END=3683 /DNA_ORIENTATION=-
MHPTKGCLLALAAAVLLAGTARASLWPLDGYTSCGSMDLSEIPPPASRSSDMSFSSATDTLWITSGTVLYKKRYSDGQILSSYEFGARGEVGAGGSRRLQQKPDPPSLLSLGVTAVSETEVAVTDRQAQEIIILSTDSETHEMEKQRTIPLRFAPYSLGYDGAYGTFYATSAEARNAVYKITADGNQQLLFDDNTSDVPKVTQGGNVDSIHYASNTGTLFVLCGDCGLVFEVTVSGKLVTQNAKDVSKYGSTQALSFSLSGTPMLLLTSEMSVKALCQDIPLSSPVLPPDVPRQIPPQDWLSLFTYRWCGTWPFEGISGPVFTDLSMNPRTRTVWALVDGQLSEYDIRGNLLRTQTKEMLEKQGLSGLTSLAWMKNSKILVGMAIGNKVAVVDTAPEAAKAMVPEIFMKESGLTVEDSMEPAGPEEEAAILRQINMIAVEFVAELGSGILPADSLGAIAYEPTSEAIFFTTVPEARSTAVYKSGIDGSGTEEVLSQVTEDGVPISEVSDLVYSPERDSFLMWCESCAKLLQVPGSSGSVNSRRRFPLMDDQDGGKVASSFTATPDGSVLMFGQKTGEVVFYCSTGDLQDNELIKAVRGGTDLQVDPLYFWRTQEIQSSSSAKDNDAASRASNSYEYLEKTSCGGANLAVLYELDLQDCEELCSLDTRCVVFSMLPSDGTCYLKSTCESPTADADTISGIKPGSIPDASAPSLPSPMFTEKKELRCEGTPLARVRDVTIDQCATVCGYTDVCLAVVYTEADSVCQLMAECSSLVSEDGTTSGTDISFPTPSPTHSPDTGSSGDKDDDDNSDYGLPGPPKAPALYGGWEWDGRDCTPWEGKNCGRSDNPGLKIGDITWYRMYAHKANPLVDRGNGLMEWTPYRTRNEWGKMYYKGSEILGFLDKPLKLEKEGDTVSMTFRWMTIGSIQEELCGTQDASMIDCHRCNDKFGKATGEKYIYWETRCFSGTGDFRVGLLDSSRGEKITKDGYGYWNEDVTDYRGLQWRFHPHACPDVPRDVVGGYAATAAASWIRSNIQHDEPNSQGLVCDFVENSQLGDRSFKERMFDPADDGACLNLPNGEFTPDNKPFKMSLTLKDKSRDKIEFLWRMEFNGWKAEKVEVWDADLVPETIDSIVIGYTNSRSFTTLQLQRID